MSAVSVPSLITPGVIARRLGVPLHRVTHILSTRDHIQPSARAGTLRLYDAAAVEAVRKELNFSRQARRPQLRIVVDDSTPPANGC